MKNFLRSVADQLKALVESINSSFQEIASDSTRKRNLFGLFSLLIVLLGILFGLAPEMGFFYYKFDLSRAGAALITSGFIGLVAWVVLDNFGDSTSAIIRSNYEAASERAAKDPSKAKPAWDMATATLDAYFSRNLKQINWIFWLSVVVMFAGFLLVSYGITLAFQTPENVTVAIIGGVAGVITQFIGATFLFIYRSTVKQAGEYTKTLERINSVGMAMQILDTIMEEENVSQSPDSSEKLIDAKIDIAKLLLSTAKEESKSITEI